MQQQEINDWYRHEVLTHPETYPELYATEIKKNQLKFLEGTQSKMIRY
jgi:hypothetical protein